MHNLTYHILGCLGLLVPPSGEERYFHIAEGAGFIELELLYHRVQDVLHCCIQLYSLVSWREKRREGMEEEGWMGEREDRGEGGRRIEGRMEGWRGDGDGGRRKEEGWRGGERGKRREGRGKGGKRDGREGGAGRRKIRWGEGRNVLREKQGEGWSCIVRLSASKLTSIVVFVHCLQPSHIVMCVGDYMHVDLILLILQRGAQHSSYTQT